MASPSRLSNTSESSYRGELVTHTPRTGQSGSGIALDIRGHLHVARQPSLLNRVNSMPSLSTRLDKSWTVLDSHQTDEANRCVDILSRPNT